MLLAVTFGSPVDISDGNFGFVVVSPSRKRIAVNHTEPEIA